VVALRAATGHEHGRVRGEGLGDQVLQLAHLVAAAKIGEVVALDPEVVRSQAERGR